MLSGIVSFVFLLFSFVAGDEHRLRKQNRSLQQQTALGCSLESASDACLVDPKPLVDPFRSPEFCPLNESFPTYVKERTLAVRQNPDEALQAGYFFQLLDEKAAGYIMTANSGMRAPKVFCCLTALDELQGCLNALSNPSDGFVIKATGEKFHSSRGTFVFPFGLSGPEFFSDEVMTVGGVVAELISFAAGKIIVEEFVSGGSGVLPTEYKFHMFNGVVGTIDVIANRGTPCQCYASIDEFFGRLDQFGCFQPSIEDVPRNGECAAIDFDSGANHCGPVKKDLPLCSDIPLVDSCVLRQMIDAASQLSELVSVYVRVDMFVNANGDVFVQEYSTNPMNGLRHCAATTGRDGCVDSCFQGRLWTSLGGSSLYGGSPTGIPPFFDGWTSLSDGQQCRIVMQTGLVVDPARPCVPTTLERPTQAPIELAPPVDALIPTPGPVQQPSSPRPTVNPVNYNCEQLTNNFQVRWAVEGNQISFELAGKIGKNEYMAFGRSGDDDETYMTGTDAVVADSYNGEFRARDFFMNGRRPCDVNKLTGVCPDTVAGFVDDVFEVSGELSNGVTVIRYVRPVTPSDVNLEQGGVSGDLPISVEPGERTFVSWAVGSVNQATGLPGFHSTAYPGRNYTIEFGRSPKNSCGLIGSTRSPSSSPTPLPTTSSPTDTPTSLPSRSPVASPVTSSPTRSPTPANAVRSCVKDSVVSIPAGPTNLVRATSGLCVLALRIRGGDYKPVGRSYSGGDWEAAAGEFTTMTYSCTLPSCSVVLPPLTSNKDKYQLIPFHGPGLSTNDEIARFLEQATFGVTSVALKEMGRRRLQACSTSVDLFASWMKDQMNPLSTPPSFHREFFRQRVNSRFELPSEMGIVTHPCQKGARYRLYAFTMKDKDRFIELETKGEKRIVSVNGKIRTVVSSVSVSGGREMPDGKFEVCARPSLPFLNLKRKPKNSKFSLRWNGCKEVYFNKAYGNPVIDFDISIGAYPTSMIDLNPTAAVQPDETMSIYYASRTPKVQEILLTKDISTVVPSCKTFGITGNPEDPVFAKFDGKFWIHDPRYVLVENTVQNPLVDGGGAMVQATQGNTKREMTTLCSAAPRTFVNQEGCTVSSDRRVCGGSKISDVKVELKSSNFKKIFEVTGGGAPGTRYVYAIDKLQITNQNPSPCLASSTSRWVKVKKCKESAPSMNKKTREAFIYHLSNSNDNNKFMRDILMPSNGKTCHTSDRNKRGFEVDVDGVCWKNVHPNHLQVFDMTYWTRRDTHPGNLVSEREPIKEFVNQSFVLQYPIQSHPMERWEMHEKQFYNIGRLGDKVLISTFPEALLTDDVAEAFDALDVARGTGVVVCGTPGEVKNNLNLGGDTRRGAFDVQTRYNRTSADPWFSDQRKQVWTTIVLQGVDQLRQRMAWALTQILVVSTDAITDKLRNTESFVTWYDIFVRHAFGNYRDLLLEVSYSPLMGEMLTYLDSKSTSFVWEASNAATLAFPDENYAREIMQLFTTGLYELEQNGNIVLDGDGEGKRVYLNDDIEELSRIWTGFRRQPTRGNVERLSNRIDPMKIEPAWRDQFPKMGLDGIYVGDGYPLCADLPKRNFLIRGAKYRRVGSTGRPELHVDPARWGTQENPDRLRANKNGSLYNALCKKNGTGNCQYPMNVVLSETLKCSGIECTIDTVRTIEVETGVFYEYLREPCVEQAFYPNPTKIVGMTSKSSVLCADPRTAAANVACCATASESVGGVDVFEANSAEKYWGERVMLETASKRCAQMCAFPDLERYCKKPNKKSLNSCSTESSAPTRFWTSDSCQLMAKIDPADGSVAIVHQADTVPGGNIAKQVQEDTKTFFRVHWRKNGSKAPRLAEVLRDVEKNSRCSPTPDGAFLCPATVSNKTVYTKRPSSIKQVLNELMIGAFPPSGKTTKNKKNGITIWNFGGKPSTGVFNDSVFEVTDANGRKQFRKNEQSIVSIVGTTLSFRNPPHFIGISDREPRDMEYETFAAVDHYFYHPNTAPFLAIRFAQRFGNSNPSPRYIATIAKAFREGSYVVSGQEFGTGVYGDLSSTLAAVLLDREARDPVLDMDFGHGSLREPIFKLVGLMRSLEFTPRKSKPFVSFKADLQDLIGQESHEIPSVFSFFLPEFKLPNSRATTGGLVTPEAGVLTAPKIIQTMNGLLSLLRNGLDECYGGFGDGGNKTACKPNSNDGSLQFKPSTSGATAIVDELASILTAGRLNPLSRKVAKELYQQTTDKKDALVLVEQLIVSSAEFHSTGRTQRNNQARPKAELLPPPKNSYKAIVVVMLKGGYDSWNMLVPHQCNGKNDKGKTVRVQYEEERGNLAFIESERKLKIDVENSKQKLRQPCSKFVVHDELKVVQQLYKEGDLSFFANMGVINQPVTKKNYNERTKTQLFAHNACQEESKRVDPFNVLSNTGVLGRALDVLESKSFRSNALSIDDPSVAVRGTPGRSPDNTIVSRKGPSSFNPGAQTGSVWDITDKILDVNNATKSISNAFAEVWSSGLVGAVDETLSLKEKLDKATLKIPLVENPGDWDETMAMALKLIQSNKDRGVDRDVIHLSLGSWDHHRAMKANLRSNFAVLNRILTHFVAEMKALNQWNNVALVVTSDFARTMTPNSGAGSDHAWGGHYFMLGGRVKGGRIHGRYPSDITAKGLLNIGRGRGRMIPELGWESMWNGVMQWFGIQNQADLDHVMPNRKRMGATLFNKTDLFD